MTTVEKRNAVVDYARENRNPDKNCTPRLVQYWNTAKGKVFWDNESGLRTATCPCPEREALSVKSDYCGMYFKYIPELDALEVSFIVLDGNRGVDKTPKFWGFHAYTERYFIFKDDLNVYTDRGRVYETNKKYANDNMLYRLSGNGTLLMSYEKIEREIKKFAPGFYFKNHWGLYDVKDWYRLSFIQRRKSNKTEEISAYEFDEAPDYICQDNKWERKFSYFEITKDEKFAVIRVFNYTNDCHGYEKRETERVFIDTKGKVSVLKEIDGEWTLRAKPEKTWCNNPIINILDMKEWKPLEYIIDCIPVVGKDQVTSAVTILRHPIIEMLEKSGYHGIARKMACDGTVAANIKTYFCTKEAKKGNINKRLGVNKYMLQKLNENLLPDGARHYYHTSDIIKGMKYIYGEDISSLSKETVDMLWPIFAENGNLFARLFGNCHYYYVPRLDRDITEEEKKFFLRICKMNTTTDLDVIKTYIDVRQLMGRLNNAPDIDVTDFHNANELMRIHDALVRIEQMESREREARYNERKRLEMERAQKMFDKLQKERVEKYEYADDKFCIRMPKNTAEIVTEGHYLDHCVAGYANSHANGNTNIIFLRKANEPNIPFYTIEINNDRVIQIHGKNNRWLGNDPEAIPFVYEWVNKIGVHCDKKMMLNKGTGYSPSSENLPESYLYR